MHQCRRPFGKGFDPKSTALTTWAYLKDYIFRDTAMPAATINEPGANATKHFAVNHLGTPQFTTDAVGGAAEVEHYWGFGGIAGNDEPSDETQRFTGHERDFHLDDNQIDDLDYMHARYCSPHLRRFLSVDPARSAKPGVPQSWSRYAYTRNNPVKFIDPDGKETRVALMFEQDERALMRGEITAQEFQERNAARASGALGHLVSLCLVLKMSHLPRLP